MLAPVRHATLSTGAVEGRGGSLAPVCHRSGQRWSVVRMRFTKAKAPRLQTRGLTVAVVQPPLSCSETPLPELAPGPRRADWLPGFLGPVPSTSLDKSVTVCSFKAPACACGVTIARYSRTVNQDTTLRLQPARGYAPHLLDGPKPHGWCQGSRAKTPAVAGPRCLSSKAGVLAREWCGFGPSPGPRSIAKRERGVLMMVAGGAARASRLDNSDSDEKLRYLWGR